MVAIKDFEMPKNCWDCPIFYDYLHCPLVDKKNEGGLAKHRASNCPLVEIEEPTTKNDLGVEDEERTLALMYLKQIKDDYIDGAGYERHPLPEYYAIETAIKLLELPSVTPIRPKGHWKKGDSWSEGCGMGETYGCYFDCSNCGGTVQDDYLKCSYSYCPYCGSDNREVEE